MARRKVQLIDNLKRVIWVDPDATYGATIGVNVFNQDGSLFVPFSEADDGGNDLAITIWRYILEIPPNVVALEKAVGTGLFVVTGPSIGAFRGITEGPGIDVANGDGVTGDPVVSHEDTSSVADISASFTGGTVPDQIVLTFDTFGHVLTRTITGRTLDHNDTGALQGGNATERYHFTAAEHTGLLPWTGEDPDDYALITQTITNGDTTHAPSGDAVFDAMSLKADAADLADYLPLAGGVMVGTISAGIDDFRIAGNTVDGADTRRVMLASGPTASASRGAYILLHGNEHANAGLLQFAPGTGADCVIGGAAVRPPNDSAIDLGGASNRWLNGHIAQVRPGNGVPIWTAANGSPEGVIVAPVGSMYTRTDGGAGTTLYIKESGAGNTGWVAK